MFVAQTFSFAAAPLFEAEAAAKAVPQVEFAPAAGPQA
jgi:hypothetical protein